MDSINNPQLMTDEQARRLGLYRPEKPKHYETQQRSGMTLNEYQNAAWPFLDENSRSPSYTLLGVGEEAGELQGKFAKPNWKSAGNAEQRKPSLTLKTASASQNAAANSTSFAAELPWR